jgi:hypothetical protein
MVREHPHEDLPDGTRSPDNGDFDFLFHFLSIPPFQGHALETCESHSTTKRINIQDFKNN